MTDNKELQITKIESIRVAGLRDEKNGTGTVHDHYEQLLTEKKNLDALRVKQVDQQHIDAVDRSLAALHKNIDELTNPPALQSTEGSSASIKAYLELIESYRNARDQVKELTERYGKNSVEVKEAMQEMAGYKRLIEPIQASINKTGQLMEPPAGQAEIPGVRRLIIQINEEQVSLPCSFHEITLAQRIDYAKRYGNELHISLKAITALQDEQEREISLALWSQDRMFQEMAFFTGIDPEVLENSGMDQSIKDIYDASLSGLIDYE